MNKNIINKFGEEFTFKNIEETDSKRLGVFFESLSAETRSRFGPHPLTTKQAEVLCQNIFTDKAKRFITLYNEEVVGYFILDFNEYKDEIKRYADYNVNLNMEADPVFAPCISDTYQNKGIASISMIEIINFAKEKNVRSLVLMGGTQATNELAIKFYEKFNFKKYGTFYTTHNNLNNYDMRLLL